MIHLITELQEKKIVLKQVLYRRLIIIDVTNYILHNIIF